MKLTISPDYIEMVYKDLRESFEECPHEDLRQWALRVSDYLHHEIGTSTALALFLAISGVEEQRMGTPKECFTRGVSFLHSLTIELAADLISPTIQ